MTTGARTTSTSGPIEQAIDEMARTPRSSITMCHEQTKTAVYMRADDAAIVEEPPRENLRAPNPPEHRPRLGEGPDAGAHHRHRGEWGGEDDLDDETPSPGAQTVPQPRRHRGRARRRERPDASAPRGPDHNQGNRESASRAQGLRLREHLLRAFPARARRTRETRRLPRKRGLHRNIRLLAQPRARAPARTRRGTRRAARRNRPEMASRTGEPAPNVGPLRPHRRGRQLRHRTPQGGDQTRGTPESGARGTIVGANARRAREHANFEDRNMSTARITGRLGATSAWINETGKLVCSRRTYRGDEDVGSSRGGHRRIAVRGKPGAGRKSANSSTASARTPTTPCARPP